MKVIQKNIDAIQQRIQKLSEKTAGVA